MLFGAKYMANSSILPCKTQQIAVLSLAFSKVNSCILQGKFIRFAPI